jgi:hypothetical protein
MGEERWHGARTAAGMFKSLRSAVVLGCLGVAFLACSAGIGTVGNSQPTEQAQITAPTSGLQITASISSVTLGDECGDSASGESFAPSADCAEAPSPADGGGGAAKKPGGCGGGSYCQQSNVQINFTAGAGNASAKVEVVSVTLVASADGALVDTLTARKPQAWNGNGYSAWDQTIKPAGELKASYDLSAPSWSKQDSTRLTSYSTKYRLHVTLRIDGIEITLLSTDLSREPAVAT